MSNVSLLLEHLANKVLLDDLRALIRLYYQDFFVITLLILFRGDTEDIPIVSDHDLEGLHQVLGEDEIVRGELKRSEYVGGHDRSKVMHVHFVVLTLLGHFEKELDDEDEHIPIDCGEESTDFLKLGPSLCNWGV